MLQTVKRALHELVDAGFIQKHSRFRDNNRGQTSNLYTLVFNAPEPNDDNTLTQEDNIDTHTGKNVIPVTYISFATLKAEKQTRDSAVIDTVPCTDIKPVKTQKMLCLECGQTGYRFVQGKLHKMAAAPCRWTGAEVNLRPPLNYSI